MFIESSMIQKNYIIDHPKQNKGTYLSDLTNRHCKYYCMISYDADVARESLNALNLVNNTFKYCHQLIFQIMTAQLSRAS